MLHSHNSYWFFTKNININIVKSSNTLENLNIIAV